jgi:hypothetical protein
MAIPAPAGIGTTAEGAAFKARAWAPARVRSHWAWRSYRRRWPPECVVGWEHFYWWGRRYSCYYPSIRRHGHFDRRTGPH